MNKNKIYTVIVVVFAIAYADEIIFDAELTNPQP